MANCVGRYSVELKASAWKEPERLPAKLIEKIFPKLEGLALEPRPAGRKKLKGGQRGRPVRRGDCNTSFDKKPLFQVTRNRNQGKASDRQGISRNHVSHVSKERETWEILTS